MRAYLWPHRYVPASEGKCCAQYENNNKNAETGAKQPYSLTSTKYCQNGGGGEENVRPPIGARKFCSTEACFIFGNFLLFSVDNRVTDSPQKMRVATVPRTRGGTGNAQ